jgi:hypothetical protein
MRGEGGGGCGVSANEYSCAHGAQIKTLVRSNSIFNPMIFSHSQSDSSSEFLSDEESEESQDESEHEYPDRQQQYR